MPFVNLSEIDPKEVFPGFRGRIVHSHTMTFVHWIVEAGATLPAHSHPHEQVATVLEGEFELTICGEKQVLGAEGVAVIPSNAVHSGKALTPCRIIDTFYPIREDYRNDPAQATPAGLDME